MKHPKPPPPLPPPGTARNEPKWSATPPTEPGWYWCRLVKHYPVVVEVRCCTTGLEGIFPTGWKERFQEIEWYPVRIEEPPR